MALITDDTNTFLNGLSDFWHRYFEDLGDVRALFEGTEVVLGQAYLDTLEAVLNRAAATAPLFHKEAYRAFAVRGDEVVWQDGAYLLARETDAFLDVPRLQNRIFQPTAALERDVDYEVRGGVLRFQEDPSQAGARGFPVRRVTVGVGGVFTAPGVDVSAARKGDVLHLAGRTHTLVDTTDGRLALSRHTPLPPYAPGVPTAYAWMIRRGGDVVLDSGGVASGRLDYSPTLDVPEVCFWGVDAKVDDGQLYENFGHLLGKPQLASEAYRAFVQGLMRLYQFGPSLERMQSALNLTCGLPVARQDGETVLRYEPALAAQGAGATLVGNRLTVGAPTFTAEALGGFVTFLSGPNRGLHPIQAVVNATTVDLAPGTHGAFQDATGLAWQFSYTGQHTITTDVTTYTLPQHVTVRPDIVAVGDGSGPPVVLRAFDALSAAVRVVDAARDDTWWHTITIPEALAPGWTEARRTITPARLPNVVGNGGCVGDPEFRVSATPVYRHSAAYLLFQRYLRHNTFGVFVTLNPELTGLHLDDVAQLVQDVKPAGTYAYIALA